jgi:hypothetical protein
VRDDDAQQPIERDAGLGANDAARAIEGEKPVQPIGDEEPAVPVEADVAIGSAPAVTQNRRAVGRERRPSFIDERRPRDRVRNPAEPAPG